MEISGLSASGLGAVNRASIGPQSNQISRSTAMQTVLQALGVKGADVVFHRQAGVQLAKPIAATLESIRVLQPSKDQLEALKSLGLNNVEMAMVVNGEWDKKKVRERLNEMARSFVDGETLEMLKTVFGDDVEEAVLDADGSVILFNAMKEVKESIKENE